MISSLVGDVAAVTEQCKRGDRNSEVRNPKNLQMQIYTFFDQIFLSLNVCSYHQLILTLTPVVDVEWSQ